MALLATAVLVLVPGQSPTALGLELAGSAGAVVNAWVLLIEVMR